MVDDGWTETKDRLENERNGPMPSAPGPSGPDNRGKEEWEEELEEQHTADFPNRLEDSLEPADEMIDGLPDSEEEKLKQYAGIGERLTGVPMEDYVDDLYFESLDDGEIARTEIMEKRNETGVIENEVTVMFDPEFQDMGQTITELDLSSEQIDTIAQEYFHASGYNDDRARMMRDLGLTPYQTKKIHEYEGEEEIDEEEAVSEFLARTVNPHRERITDTDFRDPYEGFVRSLVKYLDEEDALPEPDRVSAIKNDEEFGEELDVDYVDAEEHHYIETGTYRDEDGEESYALILGDTQETELFKDYMAEDQFDQIIEDDLDYLENSKDPGEFDDKEENYLDPLQSFELDEEGIDNMYEDEISPYETEVNDDGYSLRQVDDRDVSETVIGGEPGNMPIIADDAYDGGVDGTRS